MAYGQYREPMQYGSQDAELIAFNLSHGAMNVSRQTTTFETGSAGIACDLTANSNAGCAPWGGGAGAGLIVVYQGYFGLSGSPSQEMSLMTFSAQTPASTGDRHVRIQTDRSLKIYDKNGLPIISCPDIVIPTSGGKKLTFVFDGMTLPTIFISICVDGDWKVGFDTGMTGADFFTGASKNYVYMGEKLGASNPGVSLYADNTTARTGGTGDQPHITAYPNILVHEPVAPDSNGNYQEWTNEVPAPPTTATYTSVDDAPDDADTTLWQSTTTSSRQLCDGPAYSFGGGTLLDVQGLQIHRLTGAGKVGNLYMLRLSGTDTTTAFEATPTTSYGGNLAALTSSRPGGGSWGSSDFAANTLEWGAQSAASSAGSRVTQALGPVVSFHTASLPLGPTPVQRHRYY